MLPSLRRFSARRPAELRHRAPSGEESLNEVDKRANVDLVAMMEGAALLLQLGTAAAVRKVSRHSRCSLKHSSTPVEYTVSVESFLMGSQPEGELARLKPCSEQDPGAACIAVPHARVAGGAGGRGGACCAWRCCAVLCCRRGTAEGMRGNGSALVRALVGCRH